MAKHIDKSYSCRSIRSQRTCALYRPMHTNNHIRTTHARTYTRAHTYIYFYIMYEVHIGTYMHICTSTCTYSYEADSTTIRQLGSFFGLNHQTEYGFAVGFVIDATTLRFIDVISDSLFELKASQDLAAQPKVFNCRSAGEPRGILQYVLSSIYQ